MTYFVKEALSGAPIDDHLYDAIKARSPVPVYESPKYRGGSYAQGADDAFGPRIQMPTAPRPMEAAIGRAHVLAHEAGHAQFDQTALGRFSQGGLVNSARKVTPWTAFGTGAAISASGANRGWHALGLAANMAPRALGLLNEHTATSNGRKILEGLGSTNLGAYDANLGRAFGTYAKGFAKPVLTYGAGVALGEGARYWRSRGKSQAEQQLGLPTAAT